MGVASTQLLCTFCAKDDIDYVVDQINDVYDLAFNVIYILDNLDDDTQAILTYNIFAGNGGRTNSSKSIDSTISVHRKKQTNTIYTINAVNKLIMEKNGGVLDTKFRIDWDELNNMVLVTAYDKLKRIRTKISEIRRLTK